MFFFIKNIHWFRHKLARQMACNVNKNFMPSLEGCVGSFGKRKIDFPYLPTEFSATEILGRALLLSAGE